MSSTIAAGLNYLQHQRDDWVAANFGDKDTLVTSIMGAVEEVGELAHHWLKREQGIRGTAEEHTAEIRDAVADCIIYLMGVASHEGFELGTVVEETWREVVSKRDWQANPHNGQLTL
jgi:NTP pyrophosphatase (non-canonical NTP hydrolase)